MRALDPAVIHAIYIEVGRELPDWTPAHCSQEAIPRLLEPRETMTDVIAEIHLKAVDLRRLNFTKDAEQMDAWADRLERTQHEP